MHRSVIYNVAILICFLKRGLSENVDSLHNVTRNKREFLSQHKYLLFPQGSNVQLIYCLTIGTYTRPQGTFTFGVTAGLAYELPHTNSVPYRKPAEVYHRRSRRDLYRKVEIMLRTQGKDGKACVLKVLCEVGKRNTTEIKSGSFMEEILYAAFSLPSGFYDEDPETEYDRAHFTTEDCDKLFPTCPGSILKTWSGN